MIEAWGQTEGSRRNGRDTVCTARNSINARSRRLRVNTATTSLAAVSVLVHSRTPLRELVFIPNFRGIRDEAAE